MRNYFTSTLLLVAVISVMAACQTSKKSSENKDTTSKETASSSVKDTSLVAQLSVPGSLGLHDSIPLHFNVFNPTEDTLRFTKYHTPFEGFLNNFLTIKDTDGNEVTYIGPMAKRIMPPVPESYVTIAPHDSLSVNIDLRKGYRFEKKGTYTIQYNGGNVSGMADGEGIKAVVGE
ncbi:MAG TPA: hypothetical protein VN040_09370 [Pseudosphingobacterium sp.]|nr:hypothetical protein [Pseudosphingobacterium sp.]